MSDDGGLDLHGRGLNGVSLQRRGRTWRRSRSDGLRGRRSRGAGCSQDTRERQGGVLD